MQAINRTMQSVTQRHYAILGDFYIDDWWFVAGISLTSMLPMLPMLRMFVIDHSFLYSIVRSNGRDADCFIRLFDGHVIEPSINLCSELCAWVQAKERFWYIICRIV